MLFKEKMSVSQIFFICHVGKICFPICHMGIPLKWALKNWLASESIRPYAVTFETHRPIIVKSTISFETMSVLNPC